MVTKRATATGIREGERTCPTCGTREVRWQIRGVDYVNLSPLTGNCVDCLIQLTKEEGPMPVPPRIKKVTVP